MNPLIWWWLNSRLRNKLLNLCGRCAYGNFGHLSLEEAQEQVGSGWSLLVEICFRACLHEGAIIGQIKEKWGGLRFYTYRVSQETQDLIDWAEDQSLKTCEMCGKPGKGYEIGGWWKTLCTDCYEVY